MTEQRRFVEVPDEQREQPLTDAELLALPTVAALAARHPEQGVPADIEALRSFYAFRDAPQGRHQRGAAAGGAATCSGRGSRWWADQGSQAGAITKRRPPSRVRR